MVSVDSDVAIIGAGPAGCCAALHAAKLGSRVTMFEEHGEVGTPVHCTGHISLVGLKRLALNLPRGILENEIRAVSFHSPVGYKLSIGFPSPVTCVINRRLFDQHLAREATLEGVKIIHSAHVDSLLAQEGSVQGVVVKRAGKTMKVTSRIVIDAEGVSSALLRRAGLPSLNPRMIARGVQAEVDRVDGIEAGTVEVFLSEVYAPGLFAWIVPKRDGTAKVGLATTRENPRESLRHLIRHHRIVSQRLKHSRITGVAYHPISLGGPIQRTFHSGLLVVGDAASHVKPTTGGGVIMGLTCAEIAGRTAAHAVRCGDSSARCLSDYERRWKKKVGWDLMVMRRLRLLLNGLTDAQLDRLIALSSRLGLDNCLESYGDVDFQGTSLIRMVRSPRFSATALYLLITSFL